MNHWAWFSLRLVDAGLKFYFAKTEGLQCNYQKKKKKKQMTVVLVHFHVHCRAAVNPQWIIIFNVLNGVGCLPKKAWCGLVGGFFIYFLQFNIKKVFFPSKKNLRKCFDHTWIWNGFRYGTWIVPCIQCIGFIKILTCN